MKLYLLISKKVIIKLIKTQCINVWILPSKTKLKLTLYLIDD